MEDSNICLKSFGIEIFAISELLPLLKTAKLYFLTIFLRMVNSALIIIECIIVLFAVTCLDWFYIQYYKLDNDASFSIDFSLLYNLDSNPSYFGSQNLYALGAILPLMLVIVLASITLLSAIYAIFTDQKFRKLWGWLSLFSATVLIINLVYLFIYHEVIKDYSGFIFPHIGWWLALAGSIIIGIASNKEFFLKILNTPPPKP